MASIPREEIYARIRRLQALLDADQTEAAIIVQRADLFYFSGTGQDGHLIIPADGEPILAVKRNFDRAREESPLDRVIPLGALSDLSETVGNSLSRAPGSIGMELDVLPVNHFRKYESLFPDVTITDVSPLVRELRAVKSAYELSFIREAARMNHTVFSAVKDLLEEGITETEFAGLIESAYRRLGHQGYVRVRSFNNEVFYGHVMSGPDLAYPSCSVGPTGGRGMNPSFPQGAGPRIIRAHEPVQIDYVGVVNGYLIDQARTFYIGEPPEKLRRLHGFALEVQDATATEARPGASCAEIYESALRMVREAGLEEGFMGYPDPAPFVGHGFGLELDEWPVIGRRSPHVLAEGMVVAIEPKFIVPGEGLAGIENSFLVTAEGAEKLTPFDDTIQVV